MKLGIDFDGTIAEHMFPEIGPAVPGAIEWLKVWKGAGAKLILWTMRSDGQQEPFGDVLTRAVEWCRERGVVFDAVNEGIGDRRWTKSPKAHCHQFIDDAGFGCPLIPATVASRPMVNWDIVGPAILEMILAADNTPNPLKQ